MPAVLERSLNVPIRGVRDFEGNIEVLWYAFTREELEYLERLVRVACDQIGQLEYTTSIYETTKDN